MRKLVLALGSVLALVCGAALLPHVVSAAGLNAVATGGGFSACNEMRGGIPDAQSICPASSTGQHFSFSARVDATTGAVSGHAVFWFVNGDTPPEKKLLQVGGQVTCAQIVGNTANITFQVSQVSGSDSTATAAAPPFVTFSALDQGPPSANNPNFDMITAPHATGLLGCTVPNTPLQLVTRGNITIQTDTGLLAVPMTDGSTYNVTNAGDVFSNDGTGWLQAP